MEPSLNIFVSSVIEAFRPERQALKSMLEEIPFNRPWLFEYTPASSEVLEDSYLHRVEACDVFILLLGSDVSEPVIREWQTATRAKKPRLVFLQKTGRTPRASGLIRQIDVKWMEFTDLESLKTGVKDALLQELIRNYKAYRITEPARSALSEALKSPQQGKGDEITISIHAPGGGPIAAGKNIRQVVSGANDPGGRAFTASLLQVLGASFFLFSTALFGGVLVQIPWCANLFPEAFSTGGRLLAALGLMLAGALLFLYGRKFSRT